jgi:hypothetical protein
MDNIEKKSSWLVACSPLYTSSLQLTSNMECPSVKKAVCKHNQPLFFLLLAGWLVEYPYLSIYLEEIYRGNLLTLHYFLIGHHNSFATTKLS